MGREDATTDGDVGDPLVAASGAVRLIFNLLAHQRKVRELLPLGVDELGILCTK